MDHLPGSRLARHPARRRVPLTLAGAALAAAVTTALGFAGCQAFGGHPGGDPVPLAPAVYPAGLPCLGTCVPDPGSGPVDCSASSGVDTLPVLKISGTLDNLGYAIAANLYTYSDGTAQTYAISSAPAPIGPTEQSGYQPHTQEVDLCGSPNFALHIVGGYVPGATGATEAGCAPFVAAAGGFRGYGGGVGISMQKLNDSDSLGDNTNCYCNPACTSPHPEVCPPPSADYAVRVAALDVSGYDGVSFWARRGPNGQEAVGVNVGDQYTDDDLSYLTYRNDPTAPRNCERVRQCACSNQKPCLYQSTAPAVCVNGMLAPATAGYYCMPLDPVLYQSISGQGSNLNCDVTECNVPYAAYPNFDIDGGMTSATGGRDPQFYGRPCTPFDWNNGVGSSFCFDPATDPAPADPTQQCGDHWMKMVDLDTDWHFYRIPFTDLRQQGYGKKSEQLDLHAVSLVRFTWTAGWIDYWIDEVSFYRNPR
jgi:hypothetical protein